MPIDVERFGDGDVRSNTIGLLDSNVTTHNVSPALVMRRRMVMMMAMIMVMMVMVMIMLMMVMRRIVNMIERNSGLVSV